MMRPTRPATILTAAAALVIGAVPATTALASPARPSSVVPDDWVVLEDDTGLLTVAVPPDWADTATAPATDDGSELGRITAATDIDTYRSGFEEPGVTLVALPYNPDTTSIVASTLSEGCRAAEDSRYDDGAFVGVLRHWTACGFGENEDAEVFIVAAAPVNRSVTLRLLVQIAGPEQRDVVEGILATFNLRSESVV